MAFESSRGIKIVSMGYPLRTLLILAAVSPVKQPLMMALWMIFAVGVMVYGWATLFWPTIKRGQFSLLSLFVLTFFVAVGVPLMFWQLPVIEMR
jgi:hypothetical protein